MLKHYLYFSFTFFRVCLQAAISMSQGSFQHRLEFVVGSHVVPYDMTVYQAVRQYSPVLTRDGACIDAEHPWLTQRSGHTHTSYSESTLQCLIVPKVSIILCVSQSYALHV